MRKLLFLGLAMAVALALSTVPAKADSFTFSGGGGGGVWFSPGDGQSLQVMDAVIDAAFRESLGISFIIFDGFVNFETGEQISCSGTCDPDENGGPLAVLFAGGGEFVLTGGFDTGESPAVGDTSTELVRGFFLPGSIATFFLPSLADPDAEVGSGTFEGRLHITFIHPDLLEALGFPRDNSTGVGEVSNDFTYLTWSSDDGLMIDAAVDRTDVEITPVPEGSTLLLFGSGLVGAAGFLRRKVLARFQSAE